MRKLCLLPLLLLFGLFTSIKLDAQDSTKAALQISILTCAPGEDVYTAWGHTAIRIIDSTSQTDVVYNFGTFDFNTPNFLAEFVKGNLNYFLSAEYFESKLETALKESEEILDFIDNEISEEASEKLKLKKTYNNTLYVYTICTQSPRVATVATSYI